VLLMAPNDSPIAYLMYPRHSPYRTYGRYVGANGWLPNMRCLADKTPEMFRLNKTTSTLSRSASRMIDTGNFYKVTSNGCSQAIVTMSRQETRYTVKVSCSISLFPGLSQRVVSSIAS
jgi:hypothetical protein